MKYKKALSWNQLPAVILGFVVVVVVLSVAGVIVTNIRDVSPDYTEAAVTNETFAASPGTYVALANLPIVENSETVYNYTGGVLTRGVNYTMNYPGGSINCNGTGFCSGNLNISYTWRYFGAAWNASRYGLSGIQTISEQTPTIAIILVMGFVLIILTGIFLKIYMRR